MSTKYEFAAGFQSVSIVNLETGETKPLPSPSQSFVFAPQTWTWEFDTLNMDMLTGITFWIPLHRKHMRRMLGLAMMNHSASVRHDIARRRSRAKRKAAR